MSGYKLKRRPGLTSIHGPMDISSSRSGEEAELINSVSLSELERKIKGLIIENSELFPPNNMENTLKKARELEDNITEIIRALFRQIKKPIISKSGELLNTGSSRSNYESLIMEMITENVNRLLSLGTGTTDEALTDFLDKSSSKIRNLISENVGLLLIRLREVEETLKEYAERLVKIKALKVLPEISITDKENKDLTNQNNSLHISESRTVIGNTTIREESIKIGPSPSSLNISAFKVPHLRPTASSSKTELHYRSGRKFVLKCFSEDIIQPKYRAYAYKMPSFTQFAKASGVARITCNSLISKSSMTEVKQTHGNPE